MKVSYWCWSQKADKFSWNDTRKKVTSKQSNKKLQFQDSSPEALVSVTGLGSVMLCGKVCGLCSDICNETRPSKNQFVFRNSRALMSWPWVANSDITSYDRRKAVTCRYLKWHALFHPEPSLTRRNLLQLDVICGNVFSELNCRHI
jgi:hypothetical protein